MNETLMVQYSKEGDLEAFNRLILEYQDLAFNIAYRLMGDMAAADDITQTAFISAYQKIHTFKGGSFKAWLMRIVTNAGYDELRRLKRKPAIPLEPQKENEAEEFESPKWLIDPEKSPEEKLIQEDLAKAIQHCLDRLESDFKTIVVLVDVQGLDYFEASQIVSKPLGTIKSRLARARYKMKDCLQKFGELIPAQFRFEVEGS